MCSSGNSPGGKGVERGRRDKGSRFKSARAFRRTGCRRRRAAAWLGRQRPAALVLLLLASFSFGLATTGQWQLPPPPWVLSPWTPAALLFSSCSAWCPPPSLPFFTSPCSFSARGPRRRWENGAAREAAATARAAARRKGSGAELPLLLCCRGAAAAGVPPSSPARRR